MKDTLLTEKDIETLESYAEGYFYKILQHIRDFIDTGLKEKRFTQKEAEHDLEIALWVSYACNNIDEYEYYYTAVRWLADVEDLAEGCGVWYYRYSSALMYCGRLTEALVYAEKGVLEDPAYPWGGLQLAKLRSHFGDSEGALSANKTGLALVPGDYEFLRQEQELIRGCSLEELLNHYIYEEDDRDLSEGHLDGSLKLDAISGVVCDQENLAAIKDALQAENWIPDVPYCSFRFPYGEQMVIGVFEMNEAALSKVSLNWIRETLANLPTVEKIQKESESQASGIPADALVLDQVVFYRNQSIALFFDHSAASILKMPDSPICS